MAEVQLHGNIYEETVIRDLTGLDKNSYDKTKRTDIPVSGILKKVNIAIQILVSRLLEPTVSVWET